jgi:hypothetical protein
MTKLSVSVMSHPSRAEFFPYLKEKLGDVPFSVDDGCGLIENCRRAWEMRDRTATHHVVVQDDALISDDFISRAEAFISKHDGMAFSFYFGYRGNMIAEAKQGLKDGFSVRNRPHWGLAICLPMELIPPMLEYYDRQDLPQDDRRIGDFLVSKGVKVAFPMPSLVDHRCGVSLVGDAGRDRRAFYFADDFAEPMTVRIDEGLVKEKWPWKARRWWPTRNTFISEMIPQGCSVTDIGGGLSPLTHFLTKGTDYVSLDAENWTDKTVKCDLNSGIIPVVRKAQVVVAQGILEYMDEPEKLLASAMSLSLPKGALIFTYKMSAPDGMRKNSLPFSEVEAMATNIGWKIVVTKKVSDNEKMYYCRKR